MPVKRRVRPVYFETTIPVVRRCSCGVWFAAGVAEGIKAEVEFTPLDQGQAMWAVLQGVQLYCFTRVGLVHMDAIRLSGTHFGRLYPQHWCGIAWPPLPAGTWVGASARPQNPPY
jgi:hypothetical protein